MKNIVTQFFEVKVKYDKTNDNGELVYVKEQYVFDAQSFTEAETRATEKLADFACTNFIIDAIKKAPYGEAFVSDNDTDDRWYVAKLAFITMDEKSGKEKKAYVKYLIQASDFDTAKACIQSEMNKTVVDYNIDTLTETKILDVFLHEEKQ